ncbi:5-methyltetrahydropteroyltriglutamate--homocysteine S-methyltransferase [Chitinophaga sp. Mgbs1]|uniref:5-methyltetrahydropteroyltriglutamate--homocysteine S-methyltransferase n=1 Tax=Chitinophaga solisilvae TaxID=1233460 RepID=A0A9Q5GSB3_9BACT|nr:5-methyltetrahydropteroyltriglutamate--homocysteine S-methyltransferase [Chitinophaga solisilvae]
MQTHNLGYPRIGSQRELIKSLKAYNAGQICRKDLLLIGKQIRLHNWQLQQHAGLDFIPCNDFSFFDHVLDLCVIVGAIPQRFIDVIQVDKYSELDLLLTMANGKKDSDYPIEAMKKAQWFNTHYHYVVPEFLPNQSFKLSSDKILREYQEAIAAGFNAKPVILGPISFLLLGKENSKGFNRLALIDNLLPVYFELIRQLYDVGARLIQFDEPCLATIIDEQTRKIYLDTYTKIHEKFPDLHVMLASYFDGYDNNLSTALLLPVQTLHVDMVHTQTSLDEIIDSYPHDSSLQLSLGIVDGQNVWKNNLDESLSIITTAIAKLGKERIWLAPSCSLLHVPCDLEAETGGNLVNAVIGKWMAFAKQKIEEVVLLKKLASGNINSSVYKALRENRQVISDKAVSTIIHNPYIKQRVKEISEQDTKRKNTFSIRQDKQHEVLNLSLFPTTTSGYFPVTSSFQADRQLFRKGKLSVWQYNAMLQEEIIQSIYLQEDAGLDVITYGGFEQDYLFEHFCEKLSGISLTTNGWIQSDGNQCIKPPVIYGDVCRLSPIMAHWSALAQSYTVKSIKAIIPGPVTILQNSFVRNDQPISQSCFQIALALRHEITDVESAAIKVIEIDDPALITCQPTKKEQRVKYQQWAGRAFKIACSGVKDETQIHFHFSSPRFHDTTAFIAGLDADVLTIADIPRQDEIIDDFVRLKSVNEIGPGIASTYFQGSITKAEIVKRFRQYQSVIVTHQTWMVFDILKQPSDVEFGIERAMEELVAAAQEIRQSTLQGIF